TSFLLREANGAYHTQINDLLLTTLAYALNDLSGESVHHVTLEGHGREDIAASIDVTRTVGWFTSLYPVRLELGDDLGHSIKKIKDNIRQIPNKGVGYGALLGYAIAQMPVVSFNYLGQFEQHSEFWHVVDESSGQAMHPENQDYHLINILGMIVDSRLKLRVDARLDEQKTQQLLHALQQHLHSILAYCQSRQDKPQYTSGDFKGILSEADLAALPLLPSAEQYAWFPMTEIQKAYLLGRLGEYEIGNVSNHVYSEYYYPSLDVSKLETIINYLIKEYPVLRTVYSYEQLQQRFLSLDETPHYSIKVNDYRHLAGDEKDLQLIRERLSHQVYDPQSFPLFAFEVTQFRTMWVLHVSSDLILLDVKSRLSFFGVISALYRNPEQQITSPSISFKDYQEYYQLLKHSVWYARDKAYWESRLPSMPLRLSFPFKQSPEQIEYPSFSAHTLLVDKEDWILFKQKASDYQVSYSSVLLSLYGSVLAYFSGHKEFLITLTLFNRYAIHDEANAIWGDFTTTDLFHFKDSGKCWIDTFERTHQRMWDDVNHALYTGMEVQRVLSKLHGLDATEAVSPIVFTGVVGNKSHHFDSETFLQADEFKEKRYWCGQTSQAWIDLQAVETGDCFMSKWLYVDQLFAEDFIATLNQIYCNLIKDLAHQDWNQAIDLSHYLPQKHQEIIATANQYTRAFSEETLVSAYERSLDVSGRSELIAVIDSGKKAEYSHGELWTASEQLA
ncbi:condensation domain-containing protein, partial [Legionella santicrucis]